MVSGFQILNVAAFGYPRDGNHQIVLEVTLPHCFLLCSDTFFVVPTLGSFWIPPTHQTPFSS